MFDPASGSTSCILFTPASKNLATCNMSGCHMNCCHSLAPLENVCELLTQICQAVALKEQMHLISIISTTELAQPLAPRHTSFTTTVLQWVVHEHTLVGSCCAPCTRIRTRQLVVPAKILMTQPSEAAHARIDACTTLTAPHRTADNPAQDPFIFVVCLLAFQHHRR